MKSIRWLCFAGLIGVLPMDAIALTDAEYVRIFQLIQSGDASATQVIDGLPEDDADRYALRALRDAKILPRETIVSECERHVAMVNANGRPVRLTCALRLVLQYAKDKNFEATARMAHIALTAKSPQSVTNADLRTHLEGILILARGMLLHSGVVQGQVVTFREIALFGKELLGKEVAIRYATFNDFSNIWISELPDVHIASNGLVTRYDATAAEQYAELNVTDSQGQHGQVFVYKNPLKPALLDIKRGAKISCVGRVVQLADGDRRAVICEGFAY